MPLSFVAGLVVAVGALGYVLYPLFRRRPAEAEWAPVPSRSPRVVTDEEIEAAIRSYRAARAGGPVCAVCGARPEPDALFCSSCGRPLGA